MKRERVRDITFVALCVAILAVFSQLSIPTGAVPLTLQILAVSMAGYFLGTKRGSLTVVIYIMIGALGVPVFSSFQGGIGALLGYTGGFIVGFLPFAALCGVKVRIAWARAAFGVLGLILCHLIGTLWYMHLSKLSFVASLLVVSVPYVLKDVLLTLAGFALSRILEKRLGGRI